MYDCRIKAWNHIRSDRPSCSVAETDEFGCSYWIGSDAHSILMSFGTIGELCKDITLHKKNYSYGYCTQICYDYGNESFVLTGKHWFNIKRIVVYQLQ